MFKTAYKIISLVLKKRYYSLSFLLLVLMLFHTANVQWTGDFWAHSAAVSELAANISSPLHPHILLDAPSVLYTPYTLGVALFSRVMQINAVTALSIAGILNLFLFLYGLRLFISLVIPERAESASFYALLFSLLLWGSDPWPKSGFFYLGIVGQALPLPATFTISLVLIALSMYIWLLRDGNRLWYIPISLISVIVLISNPQTYIFLAIGLISIFLAAPQLRLTHYILLISVFVITLSAALIWPDYPFSYLLPLKTNIFQEQLANRVYYNNIITNVMPRIFPALIGIPFIFYRIKTNSRDPLGLMFIFLCMVYAYGWLFDSFGYGRSISNIVLILQMSAAVGVAQIESKLDNGYQHVGSKFSKEYLILNTVFFILFGAIVWESKKLFAPYAETGFHVKFTVFLIIAFISIFFTRLLFSSPGWFYRLSSSHQKFTLSSLILILLFTISFREQISPTLSSSLSGKQHTNGFYLPNNRYKFLSMYTKRYDVILSDMKTSWVVPTFGGKIIAPLHQPAFVPDYSERVWDIKYFFSDTTVHQKGIPKLLGSEFGPIPDKPSYSYQLEIIRKYHVDFLLINKLLISKWQKMAESFPGRIIYDNDDFVLISFDSLNKKGVPSESIIRN